MQVRAVDLQKDYEKVANWWIDYGRPPVPARFLPDTGFIIDDLAACWVYKTNSIVVCLEPMIGNPNANKTLRGQAVNRLFETVVKYSKEIGAEAVVALSAHPTLPAVAAQHGFTKIDSGQSVYYREV
jgi:hypothetical protein